MQGKRSIINHLVFFCGINVQPTGRGEEKWVGYITWAVLWRGNDDDDDKVLLDVAMSVSK